MNPNPLRLASLLLIPVLTTACGPRESPPSEMDVPDMKSGDTGPDNADMPADMEMMPDSAPDMLTDMQGDTDFPDMCEPLMQCPEKACGEVMDGCGGTLECGECACEQGDAVEQTCGPCGLGVPRCEEGTSSSEIASCEYPGGHDILSELTACEQVVYVDAQADENGDGSLLLPFSTYAEALATFGAGDRGAIIVDEGTYPEQLRLKDGVHVFAGYARLRDSWIQKPSSLAVFVSPRLVGEPAIGLRAEDMNSPTVVHSVQVEPPEALPEESTYGAYLRDVSGLVISDSIILGKDAGAGVDGTPGVAGASGGDGKVGVCALVGVGVRSDQGGAGGVNMSCPQANGGRGGAGAEYNPPTMLNQLPLAGQDGEDGQSMGGAPGELSLYTGSGKGGEDLPEYAESVAQGGAGGEAGGSLVGRFWVPRGHGADGTDGQTGSGGGGGGGAGGNSDRAQERGGGGGGAGGCGGTSGQGGSAGGASFGMLAVNTRATLINSVVYGREGGRGGFGAQGGAAGQGGQGAFGSNVDCTETVRAWRSGAGADGMDGQAGGQGGGGASGDSYGAYCESSTLTVENSTLEAGRAGVAGTGHAPGEQGLSEDELDCR